MYTILIVAVMGLRIITEPLTGNIPIFPEQKAYAQGAMSHAVIYSPSKEVEIKPEGEAVKGKGEVTASAMVVVPDIKCDLKYKWIISTYKTYQVWYVYISPEELKCLLEAGDIKYWQGATAKEAWMAAYKSGLPDAIALFEQNVKVPVQVLDSESGKQVEKMVPVTEAKALGVVVKEDTFKDLGDAMLPRKIFDGVIERNPDGSRK